MRCCPFHTLLNCSTATTMSVQKPPTKDPWWKLAIKWTVIIYGVGAGITFGFTLLIVSGGLTSFPQALFLALMAALLWPLGIVLLLSR